MIELRHLRYFLAVAEEGHVTRAAARLGMQQPPLSQQIGALERMVGVPLFHRRPRGVELTEAGRTFLGKARRVLADVDLAMEAARRTARGEAGSLAVGFTSSAAFHPLVATVVRSFRRTTPEVTLTLEEGSSVELVDALRGDRLDAAFVRTPVVDTSGITIEPLLDEAMVVALPDQHRLLRGFRPARRRLPGRRLLGRRIALGDLADQTFILYRRPTRPGLYDSIIAACHAAGFSPRIGQEAPRMASTLSLVAAGLGVSIIPASMCRLDTEGIAYCRLDGATRLVAPLHLAYRDATPSGATLRLIETVRQAAEKFSSA
jgi:DNA-binding transcriptional LysR family regulator